MLKKVSGPGRVAVLLPAVEPVLVAKGNLVLRCLVTSSDALCY